VGKVCPGSEHHHQFVRAGVVCCGMVDLGILVKPWPLESYEGYGSDFLDATPAMRLRFRQRVMRAISAVFAALPEAAAATIMAASA